MKPLGLLVHLFLSVALFARPSFAEFREILDAQNQNRGAGMNLNHIDMQNNAAGAPVQRGFYAGNVLQTTLTRFAPGDRPISDVRFNAAVEHIVRASGLSGNDTVRKTDGNITTITDKKTGEKLISVERSGVVGNRTATITMHQQNIREATFGVQIPNGTKTQTSLNMEKGPLVMTVTENSARFGLAETAQVGQPLLVANEAKFKTLSPGGQDTINNAVRADAGSQHILTVAANNGAPVVVYNAVGAPGLMPGNGPRGFGAGQMIAQQGAVNPQAAVAANPTAVLNVNINGRGVPAQAVLNVQEQTLTTSFPTGLPGGAAPASATITLKDGTHLNNIPVTMAANGTSIGLNLANHGAPNIRLQQIQSITFSPVIPLANNDSRPYAPR